MSKRASHVYAAIDRWEDEALIDPALASTLRSEVAESSSSETRRLSQYVLATTAGVVLLIAAALFLDWAWPLLGDGARTFVLAVAGLLTTVLGVRIEDKSRWTPAAYLLQTSGLGLMLAAFIVSEEAWSDMSLGGLATGAASLAIPLVLAPRAMRRNVVMPSVHFAMGFAFLAVFLDRATPLDGDQTLWVLDVVLVLSLIVLGRLIHGDPLGERHPWALTAFATAMTGGLVLVGLTAVGPLDLTDGTMYPLDAWLGLCVAVVVWAIEREHPSASREWLGALLSYLLVIWIGFGFVTALETLDGESELALLLVGGAGVVGFVYANARNIGALMGASALAFIAALWYWAIDRGGAIGAVLALGATAGILFWLSGRTGPVRSADT